MGHASPLPVIQRQILAQGNQPPFIHPLTNAGLGIGQRFHFQAPIGLHLQGLKILGEPLMEPDR